MIAQMTVLCRRLIEDMRVRNNLSPATQLSQVHAIAKFNRFLPFALTDDPMRSPNPQQ
jgi:hypothetical protein